MSIELEVVNGHGKLTGLNTSLTPYDATEEITPIGAGDDSGGIGTISFGGVDAIETVWLTGSTVRLNDTERGTCQGIVRNITSGLFPVTLQADSALAVSNVRRQAQPYHGTLGGAIRYYLSLVGITTGISIHETLINRPVTYISWEGEVFLHLKQLCVAEQIEQSVVFNQIVFRPLRQNEANISSVSDIGYQISTREAVHQIDITYTNAKYNSISRIFPTRDDLFPEAISVDGGAVTGPISVTLSTHLTSVNQPVPLRTIAYPYTGTTGAYVVLNKNNQVVNPLEWEARGGRVEVTITDQPNVIEIMVYGPNDVQNGPYRLATQSGADQYENALYLVGSGVETNEEVLPMKLGTSPSQSQKENAQTYSTPFMSSKSQAFQAGLSGASKLSVANMTVQATAVAINEPETGREYLGARFGDWNSASLPDRPKFSNFNTYWEPGAEFKKFNSYWSADATQDFERQVMGNAVGSRITLRDAKFRVESATHTPIQTDVTGSIDVTFDDFDEAWNEGTTMGDFNAHWAGHTMRDHNVRPLWSNKL